MTRLRYNGLSTTLGGSGLASGATTSVTFGAALTYNGGTSVPTIAGSDYIPLSILDSTGQLVEIVNLTAYTSGATTGTIARAQEGTSAAARAAGLKVVNSPTTSDVGLTRAVVGRDVIGASLEVMTNNRIYTKKITLANDCLITDIEAYLDAQSNVWAIAVALYADNAGAPGKLRAGAAHPTQGIYPADAGWFGSPLGMWATAGDWWLAVQFRGASTTSPFQIAYDTGGSDPYNTVAGAWLPELTGATMTDSTRNYSIRANTIW